MSRWFRFYVAAFRHPKVLALRDSEYRTWTGLLGLAAEHDSDGYLPSLTIIGKAMGLKVATIRRQTGKLMATGLLLEVDGRLRIHNWEKHQYKHDISTERTRRFRAKGTVPGTVSGTAPDTEQNKKDSRDLSSDVTSGPPGSPNSHPPLSQPPLVHPTASPSDCDSKLKKVVAEKEPTNEAEFEAVWRVYPRHVGKTPARKAYWKARKTASQEAMLSAVQKAAAASAGKDLQYVPHLATWLNQERWADEDEPARSGAGRIALCSDGQYRKINTAGII